MAWITLEVSTSINVNLNLNLVENDFQMKEIKTESTRKWSNLSNGVMEIKGTEINAPLN